MRAAEQLAEQIQRHIRANPVARQWIVAHSHGGNIALHAVKRVRESCTGGPRVTTVTLATPFIHARRRALSSWSVFLVALFGVALLGEASVTLASGPRWNNLSYYFSSLVMAETVLCLAGAGMHWGFLKRGNPLRWLGKRIAESPEVWPHVVMFALFRGDFIRPGYRTEILTSVHSPKVEKEDVIVLRSAGDEASLGLAAGQLLGWISALLNPLLTNLWLWMGIALATRVSLLVAFENSSRSLATVGFYLFMVPGFLAVAVVSVMLAAAIPFGWDGPFLSIFASFSAEAVPPGRTTVLQLESPVEAAGKGLAHSHLYRSEQGISTIVTLICGPSTEVAEPVREPMPPPSASSNPAAAPYGQTEPKKPQHRPTDE